jgi:DNA topoisomerase-2
LVPWYKGFTGKIELERVNGVVNRAVTHGTFAPSKKKNMYEITELPIGTWTNRYKDQIEDWYVNKQIDDRVNKTTVDKVYFEIKPTEQFEMSEKNLKLTSYLSMSNMVAFNGENKITKYSVEQILEEYCKARLEMYDKRRTYQLASMTEQIKYVSNKIRFLDEVMSEKLNLFMKSQSWIDNELTSHKYDKKDDSYDYLINMSIRSFTKEKLEELEKERAKYKQAYDALFKKSPSMLWKDELSELERFL